MDEVWHLPRPEFPLPLAGDFRPAVLANAAFEQELARAGGGERLILALERPDGSVSRLETGVFPEGHPRAGANLPYAERLAKFLLWQRGGYRAYVGGPPSIGRHIQATYAPDGPRAFDEHFMGREVYGRSFQVVACSPAQVPPARESGRSLGRHLDGCRIGFDLGASDRKVSALIDGRVVYSEEVIWEPSIQDDPDYHYREIRAAFQQAAAHLPRVDAIGGSSAGVFVDNQPRVASLFRGIPPERFHDIRTLFQRLGREMGVPLEVINDGEVTALAGSMSLEDNGVLGLALGSSLAAGYVALDGSITGWLNELAFAPIDYAPPAPQDEWSGDRGCGAAYLSQQCVFRLAPGAGIALPQDVSNAEKLAHAQALLEAGHEGAARIWQSMGRALGYAVAHYDRFYALRHVLILGRCTSGLGGATLLEEARRVLHGEFPTVAERVSLQLPDEKSRRVGQAIAAASLPAINPESPRHGAGGNQPPREAEPHES